MRMTPSEFFVLVARVLVGSVLMYAGFMKAVGPSAEFAAVLAAYKLFPPTLLTPLSVGLPYIEMWVGLFFFTGFCTRAAALGAVLLFMGFTVTVSSALYRGIDLISCGCFGADSFTPKHTLAMDLVLLGLSLVSVRLAKLSQPFSLDRIFP